jgi:hypothetical protein
MADKKGKYCMKSTFLIVLFFWGLTAVCETPVPLSTEEEKVAFLMHLQKTIPGLLEQAVRYDFDVFAILDSQAELQKKLELLPSYQEAQKKKSALLDFKAEVLKPMKVVSRRLRPEALSAWKKHLEENLNVVKDGATLNAELTSLTRELSKQTSQGLITGLIRSGFSKEEQTELFKLSREDQLDRLLKALPENLPGSFQRKNFQLSDSASKLEALKRVAQLEEKEGRMRALSELHVVLQDGEGKVSGNSGVLSQKLEDLNSEDLAVFSDKDALATRVTHLPSKQKKEIAGQIQENVRKYFDQLEEVTESLEGSLRLLQVPPEIGIFRGCTGGDCSSSFSFPYPNDPNEKVFFLFDEKNELKGYVTTTLVDSEKTPTLYVLSLNGPRLSPAIASLALRALHEGRQKLGAERVALTTSGSGVFSNYSDLVELHSKITSKKPIVPITYRDAATRKVIEEHKSENNSASYDHMANNLQGYLYEPATEGKENIRITALDAKLPPFSQKLDRDEVALLALQLLIPREVDSKRIFKSIGVSEAQIGELSYILGNSVRLPIKAQEKRLGDFFLTVGITKNILSKTPGLGELGFLMSSDIRDASNSDYFSKIMDKVFHSPYSNYGLALMHRKKGEFSGDPTVHKFATSMVDGESSDLRLFTELATMFDYLPDEKILKNLIRKLYSPKGESVSKLFAPICNWVHERQSDEVLTEILSVLEGLPMKDASLAEKQQALVTFLASYGPNKKFKKSEIEKIVENVLAKENSTTRASIEASDIVSRFLKSEGLTSSFATVYLPQKLSARSRANIYSNGRVPVPASLLKDLVPYVAMANTPQEIDGILATFEYELAKRNEMTPEIGTSLAYAIAKLELEGKLKRYEPIYTSIYLLDHLQKAKLVSEGFFKDKALMESLKGSFVFRRFLAGETISTYWDCHAIAQKIRDYINR